MPINSRDIMNLLPIVSDQKWFVNMYGVIRNSKGECPGCAVLNEIAGKTIARQVPFDSAYGKINGNMNQTDSTLDSLMAAADNGFMTDYQRKMRREMLLILNPTEVKYFKHKE